VELAFLGLVVGACVATAENSLQRGDVPFAIRVVDETVRGDVQQGPPGADRVPVSVPPGVPPGAMWLKREGRIEGEVLTELHASTGPNGQPILAFTFAWSAGTAEEFAALTRQNIGRRLAVVVDGIVVSAPAVLPWIADNFSKAEAGALIEGARRTLPPRIRADQRILQRVTIEATSRAYPSEVIARLSSTSTGPRHYAAVAIGDALRARFESGLFSDLRVSFDPATSIRSISYD
jgi:hypothetical protein